MPLFDCLFCCQEHFILRKIGDGMTTAKYSHSMAELAYKKGRKAATKFSDYVNPWEAFKELTAVGTSQSVALE